MEFINPFCCYIIYNENNRTYVGYTKNRLQRLKQHNELLVGGAKATRGKGPWKYLFYIESPDFTLNNCLSFEWFLKHPTNKRKTSFSGISGRLNGVPLVLMNDKFVNMNFTIYVIQGYYDILKNLCRMDNVVINILN